MKANKFLLIGGILSAIVALLHLAMIIGGADWYRFFGAGEDMAQLAEGGSYYPSLVTALIAIVIASWAVYAFSGAGLIQRLPLLIPALIFIAAIYMIRGIFGVPAILLINDPYLCELREKMTFMIVSSAISLSMGLFYLKGLMQIGNKKNV